MAKERIKENPEIKYKEPAREDYKPRKEGSSTFDQILDKNRLLQKSPQNIQVQTAKTDHNETRVARHQEQGEKGKDKQSDEKEEKKGKEKAKEERKSGADTEQRVVGRGRKGKESGGGGSKGSNQQGRGFGRLLQKRTTKSLKKGAFSRATQVATEKSKFENQLKSQMKAAPLSREFIQKIVNQIVKGIKSGINKEGNEEVRLSLHERIFRGLQLRVALKHGKVDVHFLTSNSRVRELFTGSSETILSELKAKGVEVGEIKVT